MKAFIFLLMVLITLALTGCEKARRENERAAYQELVSGYSINPQWFKKGVKPELDNEEYAQRGSPGGVLLLCTPTMRILALAVLFYPAFAAWRFKNFGDYGLLIAVGVFAAWFPIAWIIKIFVNIGVFVVFGQSYYYTFPFILLCTVFTSLLLILGFSIRPLWEIITNGMILNRLLGAAGFVLEIIGTIFNLRDVFGLFISNL